MITAHALAVGRSHSKNNANCQDNLVIKKLEEGLVFAVADGASSAVSSGYGSELAVNTFCEYLTKSISSLSIETCLIEAFNNVRKVLEEEAVKRNCNIKDLHTTLFGGVYVRDSLKCASVGDSMGFVVNKDNGVLIPLQPTKGEFVNETVFITSEYWKDYLKVSDLINNPSSLIVCSDGLVNIIYSLVVEDGLWKIIPHKDVIENLIDYVLKNYVSSDINLEIAEMLRGDKSNNLNNDDKAIIIAIFDENNRD